MRNDPQTGNVDIWTFDLASGKGTPITNDTPRRMRPSGLRMASRWPTSRREDGLRRHLSGRLRMEPAKKSCLFRYTPGAGMVLTDWSPDGKFLTFFTGVLVRRAHWRQ